MPEIYTKAKQTARQHHLHALPAPPPSSPSAHGPKIQKRIRIFEIEIQPGLRRERWKRLVLGNTGRLEGDAVMPTVRETSDALAAVAALARARGVVAAGEDHFAPEEGRGGEGGGFFFVAAAWAVCYRRRHCCCC